jgi:hypothetical protein
MAISVQSGMARTEIFVDSASLDVPFYHAEAFNVGTTVDPSPSPQTPVDAVANTASITTILSATTLLSVLFCLLVQ